MMKTSELILKARDEYLWDGDHNHISRKKNSYICHALQDVGIELPEIERRLGKIGGVQLTYESWLANYHPELKSKMSFQDIQQGRYQWMTALAEEYRAKGD